MLIWTHGTYFCGASATVDEELSTTSENAVQNKVITAALSDKVNTDQLEYYSKLEDFYKFTDSINTKVNKQKGYYSSYDALIDAIPHPEVGDWAIVQIGDRTIVYQCTTADLWQSTGKNYDTTIDLSEYVKAKYLEAYIKKADAQEKLVSGKNIKTINGKSLLGEGNVLVGVDTISKDGMKHVFVTQEEYDSLDEPSMDTVYFIYDDSVDTNWVLGDTLPITLS